MNLVSLSFNFNGRAAKLLLSTAFLTLVACSSAPVTSPNVAATHSPAAPTPKQPSSPPSMTLEQAGKTLHLVRILEGGACKNDQQGVKGVFLLYADKEDVKRIKAKQGVKVFAGFEKKITDFSLTALQAVVQQLDYKGDAQSPSLSKQFNTLFAREIAPSLKDFQQASTLTIAIKPFAGDTVFYTDHCEATKEALENENESSAPPPGI